MCLACHAKCRHSDLIGKCVHIAFLKNIYIWYLNVYIDYIYIIIDNYFDLEVTAVRDEAGEEGVAGDVERHPQTHVGRALIHLTGKFPIGHVELRHHVAGREGHLLQYCPLTCGVGIGEGEWWW